MKTVEWKIEYEIGISEIDSQHKRLVEILNSLVETKDESKIKNILCDLIEYTIYHFTCEEDLMWHMQFPLNNEQEHGDHIAEHDKFRLELRRFLKAKPSDILVRALHNFLSKWLVEHILSRDAKLKTLVNEPYQESFIMDDIY
jgi:hemerythrin